MYRRICGKRGQAGDARWTAGSRSAHWKPPDAADPPSQFAAPERKQGRSKSTLIRATAARSPKPAVRAPVPLCRCHHRPVNRREDDRAAVPGRGVWSTPSRHQHRERNDRGRRAAVVRQSPPPAPSSGSTAKKQSASPYVCGEQGRAGGVPVISTQCGCHVAAPESAEVEWTKGAPRWVVVDLRPPPPPRKPSRGVPEPKTGAHRPQPRQECPCRRAATAHRPPPLAPTTGSRGKKTQSVSPYVCGKTGAARVAPTGSA